MTPQREWLSPPRTPLLLLYLLTFVAVSALAWFGWRFFEQQRMVEVQRSRERLEQAADRITAIVGGALAETSERTASGLASTEDILLTLGPTSLNAIPAGKLLYYPAVTPEPELEPDVFAQPELFEFAEAQPNEALQAYKRLATISDPAVRAGALLRMARVLRRMGLREQSIATYEKMRSIQSTVAGVPAELVARHAICDLSSNRAQAMQLKNDLRAGHWKLTPGQFEFYWEEANRFSGQAEQPPVEAKRLAEIAAFVWNDRVNHPDPRGQETVWIEGAPIFLIWRGTPEQRRILITKPNVFIPQEASAIRYAFVDAGGRTVAGVRGGSTRSVIRTAAETELPWTLYVSEIEPMAAMELLAQRRFLFAGLSVMIVFLILATHFIARAIRREAQVQRMQSNFIATVSHEFRTPITSMRQMSEMLMLGRVASTERRQLYYQTLVNETTRLQHLIEGLLNFGKMEASARQYQFEQLDASAMVENVVSEFESKIAHTGTHIQMQIDLRPCLIKADAEAISVALRNLIDNAVKYSPNQPTVWVECVRSQREVSIRVRDTGLGVDSAEQKTIFRRFTRGSAAAAANIKGSGVGLAMVSHIMSAHRGEITVASTPGKETTFTLLFPSAGEA